jgi:hypothetical protein
MHRRSCLRWAIWGVALCCSAQEFRVVGPISGLVYDPPTRSLRLILGMPGGARISEAVAQDVDWASVSPNCRAALIRRGDESHLLTTTQLGGELVEAPIQGSLDVPNLAVWAEDSTALAVYSESTRSAQWLQIDLQGASTETPVGLGDLEGNVTAIAADRKSGTIFLAVAGTGVYRLTTGSGAVAVIPLADVSAIAIEPGGGNLWLADRANAQVLQIADPASSGDSTALIVDAEKLTDISMIGVSSDRKTIYLADRATSQLYLFDRSNQTMAAGPALDVPATSLLPLGRATSLLLGPRSKGEDALFILDETNGPSVFFVPAIGER